MPINTLEDLREHVALAAEVELSTILPYLYALYSIEDQRSESALLIRSIVVEEMLHVSLATNLLLAVGGEPRFAESSVCPNYPGALPHHVPELMVDLAPASEEVVRNTFMVIERPETRGALPEEDQYETLGQFYYALELAIDRLGKTTDVFANPQRERQLGDPSYYGAVEYDAEDSGGLVLIEDQASADAAIEIIVHQGEGLSDDRWADPSHQELTHYHKLLQIAEGTSPLGEVRPLLTNPKVAELPEEAQPIANLFNALYRYTILTLDELFQASDDKGALVDRLYALMGNALTPVARYLTEIAAGDGKMAGPTFEVHHFSGDPVAELRSMAAAVAEQHPTLAPVGEAL
jgi:hypothetical protein